VSNAHYALGYDWHDEGSLFWAENCDFKANDLSNKQIKGEQCGPECERTTGCTHFTWTKFNGGTCWMKTNPASRNQAISIKEYSVCGVMKAAEGGGGQQPTGGHGPSASGAEKYLPQINAHRAENQKSSVTWSPNLASVSQAWANRLASEGSFHHGPIDHLGCQGGGGGEIIFQGPSDDAVKAWINSPGHNAIMLDGRNKVVGCGINGDKAVCQFKGC